MSDKYSTAELRASYGVGRQMGEQLAANRFDGVDAEAVAQGVIDALNGNGSQVAKSDIDDAFRTISARMKEKQAKAGQLFLEENAKKDGVTVTASGLQYEIISAGSGAKPGATSRVKTHYHGMLIDGTVFDSSVNRGAPIDFAVNGVIGGWTEALQLMPVGSKWRLYIPSDLAYGASGAGNAIPPHAALIFDVELLEILD